MSPRKYVTVDRHYLFNRQHGACYFCGKPLKMGTLSIDHYLPKSAGGTNDVFNLVASCKSCNAEKLNTMPMDVESQHITWFIEAYDDHHILTKSSITIPKDTLNEWVHNIRRSYPSGEFTVFESPGHRFYVRLNQIEKIIAFHKSDIDE